MTIVDPPTVVRILTQQGWSDIAIQGPQGVQGLQGDVGVGVRIVGSVPTASDLNPALPGLVMGDGFIVQDTGHFFVFDPGPPPDFFDVGLIKGPQGLPGSQGAQGAGTQGPQGLQGAVGGQGVQGSQGAPSTVQGQQGFQGAQGSQGFQGVQGAPSTVQGSQGFQGVVGQQGAASTTAGPQGSQGSPGTGAQGSQGATGVEGLSVFVTATLINPSGNTTAVNPTAITGRTVKIGDLVVSTNTNSLGRMGRVTAVASQTSVTVAFASDIRGAQGNQGTAGAGAGGVGLPTGGATGTVLRKISATNHAVEWAGGSVPAGGTQGQSLTKNSNTAFDTGWSQQGFGVTRVQYGRFQSQTMQEAWALMNARIRNIHTPDGQNMNSDANPAPCGVYLQILADIPTGGTRHRLTFLASTIYSGTLATYLRGTGMLIIGTGAPQPLLQWNINYTEDTYSWANFFYPGGPTTLATSSWQWMKSGAGSEGTFWIGLGGWLSRTSLPSSWTA